MLENSDALRIHDEALTALRSGQPERARRALQSIGPALADDAQGLQLLALSLNGPMDRADKRALLERSVRIDPDNAQAHFNLAVVMQADGGLDQAVLAYRHALRLQPHHLGALNNLSDLLRRRGQAEEGWRMLQRYEDVGGDVAGLEIRYAKMAMDTRRFAEAERWFNRAKARQPNNAWVEWEHAMLTLAREDFAAGWPQYERRLEVYGLKALGIQVHDIPLWQGEALSGQSILLHREQGLGDMLMFASLFDEVIAQAKQVHIAVHPPLVRLMAHNFPRAKVWSSVTSVQPGVTPPSPWLQAAGPIDLQLPIGSLAQYFRGERFPAPRPYLTAVAADIAAWRQRLDQLAPAASGVRRIGLVSGARQVNWNDDARTNGARKTVPPSALAILAQARDIQWISLHDREMAAAVAHAPDMDVVDCSPWIDDLADTAALVATLDAVVSVDTAVAHLAGAMGKQVHLLLWRNPDWRWGPDRADSYWYRDMRLHRQVDVDDWAPVLAQALAAIGRAPYPAT